MDVPMSKLSQREFVIEMLTLQYIQGKTANSAAEYVKLYREAREEIESAYGSSFKVDNMI